MEKIESSLLPGAETQARSFITKVYGWMSAGLAATGACALYMASDPRMIVNLVQNKLLFYGLIIGELVLVMWLSAAARRMEAATATFLFLFYSALNGITMSVIFLVYTSGSIASTFFLTAGLFGIMSLYGYTTKTDLTSAGNFLFMALIGLILASLVNWWLQSPALYWITTYAGILIFTGLTAYDTQKIKALHAAGESDELATKAAILGALTLYLDFINLFLMLLRVMGRRRN